MRFKKFSVNKNEGKVVIHKLDGSLIKKNSVVEKEHIITKIKKHEKFYMTCVICSIIFIFLIISVVVGTSFKYFRDMNSYDSGLLSVEYYPTNNGIGDIITLDDSLIVEDSKIINNDDYQFTITNKSDQLIKYYIKISEDKELINLDNCSDKLFDISNIKYNINHGNVYKLIDKKVNDDYIIVEDVINPKSSRVYNLNIWLDKDTPMDNNHFHGIISVES